MDQVCRLGRTLDVPDTGIIYDLLWADLAMDIAGWAENDRGVSFTFSTPGAPPGHPRHRRHLRLALG